MKARKLDGPTGEPVTVHEPRRHAGVRRAPSPVSTTDLLASPGRATAQRSLPRPKPCRLCERVFSPRTNWQVFCCRTCSQTSSKRTYRSRR